MREVNFKNIDKITIEDFLIKDRILYNQKPHYKAESIFTQVMIFNGSGWNIENITNEIEVPLFETEITIDHIKIAMQIMDVLPDWSWLYADNTMRGFIGNSEQYDYFFPYASDLGVWAIGGNKQGAFFLIENVWRQKK